MLNNRLEDLIYKYRSYRMKQLVKNTMLLVLLFSVIFAVYFIYLQTKKLKAENQHLEKIEKKVVPKKVDKKPIKPDIIKVKPKKVKIDEDKVLDKNSLKTLMLLEKTKPTYESAVDLAEYYFNQKKYQKASKWAVVASNREPKIDKAWLIYAKSKIKLGQKGMAKKALKIYLLKYHSQKVTNLLNSL